MQLDLTGRVAIVTGAAQGIGKATAKALASSGAVVVVSDIQEEMGQAAAAEIGGPTLFVPCDVSDYSQVLSLVKTTVERFSRLDIMVNNAGINTGLAERVTADKYAQKTWRKMIDVNLNGAFYGSKAAAEKMIEQGSGSIINISSIAGVVALRLQVGFVAAKAAVIKLTEAMAAELGPYGIRVNAISPGSIPTGKVGESLRMGDPVYREFVERTLSFIPIGRLGEVEDVAQAVVFLASDAAAYITGHNLVVDGGWTCAFNRDF